jgi:hypothetical protein
MRSNLCRGMAVGAMGAPLARTFNSASLNPVALGSGIQAHRKPRAYSRHLRAALQRREPVVLCPLKRPMIYAGVGSEKFHGPTACLVGKSHSILQIQRQALRKPCSIWHGQTGCSRGSARPSLFCST